MTAVRAAGYTSAGKQQTTSGVFDPTGQGGPAARGPAPPLAEKRDNSPEDMCREMEKEVNVLIEESAQLNLERRFGESLEKAKEAGKRERKLCAKREETGLADQINIDLTYSVFFNLANQYHANGLYVEALKTYSEIVKNKQYHQSGRLRVNMGNIYFEQKKFPNAIKLYRMALDQIPNTGKDIRAKIIRNIGVAFVRLGQFQDAIASFEQIMDASADVQTGFNLLLCYYALGEAEKMRKIFNKLLAIRAHGLDVDDEDELAVGVDDVLRDDGLKEALRRKHRQITKHLAVAAKLLAPAIEQDVSAGYDWAITQLRSANYASLANELEIAKSLHFMRTRQFERAVSTLKSYENKDPQLVARAATNLSFIYFHEADYNAATKYADMAMRHNRYNAKALVNKGNVLFMREEYESARNMYQESMGADADCIEAIYNLGLASRRLGLHGEALALFEKLHGILPKSIEVVWQIASVHEQNSSPRDAIKWYNILTTHVPNDPGVLSRLGNIFLREEDEAQALHYHLEAYRFYPVNMDVIAWLGKHSVQNEMYEKATHYFERAAQIEPREVKWKLMVASCHRRSGEYQLAFDAYAQIHKDYPDNVECAPPRRADLHASAGPPDAPPAARPRARAGLRYLVHISEDLGKKDQVAEYVIKLRKAEKAHEQAALGASAATAAQVCAGWCGVRCAASSCRCTGCGEAGSWSAPCRVAACPCPGQHARRRRLRHARATQQQGMSGHNENAQRNGAVGYPQYQPPAEPVAQPRMHPGPGEEGYVESDYHLAQIQAASAVRARPLAIGNERCAARVQPPATATFGRLPAPSLAPRASPRARSTLHVCRVPTVRRAKKLRPK